MRRVLVAADETGALVLIAELEKGLKIDLETRVHCSLVPNEAISLVIEADQMSIEPKQSEVVCELDVGAYERSLA